MFDVYNRKINRLGTRLMLLISLVVFSGCGMGQLRTHPVEGQVRFTSGGAPTFGDIEFYNEEHKLNARGKINKDGSFSIGTYSENDGAIEGTHKIVIIQNTRSAIAEQLDINIRHDHGDLVDRAYFDYRTSGLTCTITQGSNRIELVVDKSQTRDAD